MSMPWENFESTSSFPPSAPVEEALTVQSAEPVAVNQPTAHATPKMANLGLSGGLLVAVLASLKAHGIDLREEDIALLILVVPWIIGWLTKDRK